MLYKYEYLKENQIIKNQIEANTIEDAKNILTSNDIYFISIKEDKKIFNFQFLFKKNLNNQLLITFSRSILIYIQSGIPLIKAFQLLIQNDSNNKNLILFYKNVYTLINEGKSLSYAIEQQDIFKIPKFYIESIRIAEENGFLENTLNELILFMEEQEEINKQIVSSIFYPIFIIVSSILMISFMIITVVPKITKIFEQTKQELPEITQMLIKTSDFLKNNYLTILLIFTFIYIIHFLSNNKIEKYREFIDLMKLKIPLFGNIILKSELSRISYLLSVLTKSGIPFVQAVNFSSNTVKNLMLKNTLTNSAKMLVEGKKFSETLKGNKIISNDFVQAIELGEETSEMSKILFNISKIYISENKNKIKIILSLIEPIMMIIVGSIIGIIVMAMILPIFSMNIG